MKDKNVSTIRVILNINLRICRPADLKAWTVIKILFAAMVPLLLKLVFVHVMAGLL